MAVAEWPRRACRDQPFPRCSRLPMPVILDSFAGAERLDTRTNDLRLVVAAYHGFFQ